MELFTYSYNIITDTLNGKLAMDKLNTEVLDSEITIAMSHITSENGVVYISFKADLDDTNEAILDSIINNHDGENEEYNLPQKVKVIEESPDGLDKTKGKFQAESIKIQIPAENGTYYKSISYKHYIGLLSATWFCNDINLGDEASFFISPDAIIGYVTQSSPSGVTEIYVNETVIENIIPGYYLSIGDDDYIAIASVDSINNIVTLNTPLPTSCTQGEYVKLRVNVLSDFHFNGIGQMTLGAAKIGSSLIPPNTKMQLEYVNNNGQAKEFAVLIEFMY